MTSPPKNGDEAHPPLNALTLAGWWVAVPLLLSFFPLGLFLGGGSTWNRAFAIGTLFLSSCIAVLCLRLRRPRMAWGFLIPGYILLIINQWDFGMLVVAISGHEHAWALLGLDLILAATLFFISRKRGWALMLILPFASTMAHVFCAGLVWSYMVWPPSAESCGAYEEQPGVVWMTRNDPLYFGSDVVVAGDGSRVALISKVWHDTFFGGLFAYHTPGLGLIDTADPKPGETRKVRIVRVPAEAMPGYILQDNQGRIAMTLIHFRAEHAVGIVDGTMSETPRFAHLVKIPQTEDPLEPNGIFLDGDDIVVFGHDKTDQFFLEPHDVGDMMWIDSKELVPLDRWQAPSFDEQAERVRHNMRLDYIKADEDHVLMSTIGGLIIDFNLRTKKARPFREILPGAGAALDLDSKTQLIAVSDILFHRIHIVDRKTERLVRTVDLDMGPRPVRWAGEHGLVLAGSFVTGDIVAYPSDEGATQVGPTVRVGGYLRRLKYDAPSGSVYAASKCGLFRIDLEEAFGAQRTPAAGP